MPLDSSTYLAPLTLPHFIAWLRTQNPACGYDVGHPARCLLGRYTIASGGHFNGRRYYLVCGSRLHVVGDIYNTVILPLPWNCGAALARAEAYQASLEK